MESELIARAKPKLLFCKANRTETLKICPILISIKSYQKVKNLKKKRRNVLGNVKLHFDFSVIFYQKNLKINILKPKLE